MPKKKPTNDSLRQELEHLVTTAFLAERKKAAAAAKAKAEAKEARRKLRALRAIVNGLKAPPIGKDGSVGYRRGARNVIHSEWPWRAALARRHMTPADYARQQVNPPLGVEAARQWLKALARRRRPVPEFWALKIAAEFTDAEGRSEVPAVDSSWPHGIARS